MQLSKNVLTYVRNAICKEKAIASVYYENSVLCPVLMQKLSLHEFDG
jgi:hypothetical protein